MEKKKEKQKRAHQLFIFFLVGICFNFFGDRKLNKKEVNKDKMKK